MNILFLTMGDIRDMAEHGIYTDLMRKFKGEGHDVYVVSPAQRRLKEETRLVESEGIKILRVKTLNVQKTSIVEKGLGQVSLEFLYKRAIKKYLGNIAFDLILYSTPPITLTGAIKYVKEMCPKAMTYLMLKDIFPQNAVDLGMLVDKVPKGFNGFQEVSGGFKYLLYRRFRKQEKELYRISDWIGCMSPANVRYVIEHNPEVNPEKVEICPNSYEVQEEDKMQGDIDKSVRQFHKLPMDMPIFIYGGNMGKPQGIPFLLECMKANKDRTDCHFVIIGNGTEYPKLEAWYNAEKPKAVTLFKSLPKAYYDKLANACDVGLIFLDYRFTIPNYPSRLLPYLMSKKPIIACTDPNCDTGSLAEENGYGVYAPSNDVEAFTKSVDKLLASDLKAMGEKGYQFYLDNYTVEHTFNAIMKHFR